METAAAAARKHASSGLTALSNRLIKELSAAKSRAPDGQGRRASGKNLVFSPLSIYTALSLVAAGAQGRTLSELLSFLGATSREVLVENVRSIVDGAVPADGPQPGGPRVGFACGLWHDATRTPKPAYRDVAAASCRAVARSVDFIAKPEKARKQMNIWAAAATNNLIKQLVPKGSVDESTRIAITSAVCFKAKWQTPFDNGSTLRDKFHRLDGATVSTKFMSSHEDHQFIGVHDGFKVLRMPYSMSETVRRRAAAVPAVTPRAITGPRYSMLVLLPDAYNGLRSLEDKVASCPGFLQDHLPVTRVRVHEFWVPKFRMSFSARMSTVLKDVGVKAVFSPGAELPDMLEEDTAGSTREPLFVGDVLHKAVVEVNEEGTEAATATAVLLTGSCGPLKHPPGGVDFVADHPFAFFLVEEVSGAILFAGHVLDPTQS
ncbi:unnamed protein product [Urochloa humidicola]